jgi:voltage-gated potassium channel
MIRILAMALLLILTFGFIAHIIEPETFPTIFDGIWWAIITTSTVGYGDFVPQSMVGKVTGIILILLGAGFLSTYFVTLAAATVTRQNAYLEGKVAFKKDHHLIVIGWNERSREIIESLCRKTTEDVVLIDYSLERNPLTNAHVHFIQGRPNQDATLLKANIAGEKKVIITADQNMDELQADMNTILTLLTIKGLNPSIFCIVEVLTSEQLLNAQRAGADEIIQSNILTSFAMMNSIASEGLVSSLVDLMNQLNGSRFSLSPITKEMVGKSFTEMNFLLLQEEILLVGIKRGENTVVNPPKSFRIQIDDQLLIISK